MAKKVKDMTVDQRIRNWEKEQKKERKTRQDAIEKLSPKQVLAVHTMYKLSKEITYEALHGGGVRYIYCDLFNQLEDAVEIVREQYNMGDYE
tara:strand:- start:550 stop:825 length:276 start_codon:yes stop_codon:yes gene_type:complete